MGMSTCGDADSFRVAGEPGECRGQLQERVGKTAKGAELHTASGRSKLILKPEAG